MIKLTGVEINESDPLIYLDLSFCNSWRTRESVSARPSTRGLVGSVAGVTLTPAEGGTVGGPPAADSAVGSSASGFGSSPIMPPALNGETQVSTRVSGQNGW